MFKAFGHDKVSILDGGLPGWESSGFELEKSPLPSSTAAEKPGTYNCELLSGVIWDMDKVRV
jgi:3-mercaptopyruvate sulfurtransferase SseA